MTDISLEDMQSDLDGLLRRVQAGETFVVYQDDGPVAEIRPVLSSEPPAQLRPFGLCAGQFDVADDFDDPLPEEIIRSFEAG